jgi:hypothetical protein
MREPTEVETWRQIASGALRRIFQPVEGRPFCRRAQTSEGVIPRRSRAARPSSQLTAVLESALRFVLAATAGRS